MDVLGNKPIANVLFSSFYVDDHLVGADPIEVAVAIYDTSGDTAKAQKVPPIYIQEE